MNGERREFRTSRTRVQHGILLCVVLALVGVWALLFDGPSVRDAKLVGAVIMFWVLGFAPAWVLAKILASMNLLRIPKEIELLGLDFASDREREAARDDVIAAKKALV